MAGLPAAKHADEASVVPSVPDHLQVHAILHPLLTSPAQESDKYGFDSEHKSVGFTLQYCLITTAIEVQIQDSGCVTPGPTFDDSLAPC